MLLCLHTTAANASDLLPPPKSYKDIHGRPDKEKWRAAYIEEFKGKVANNTFEQIEGFEEYDKTTREKLVCKLKMALE
eukprot:5175779-Pleurochrysis_carterae.AAC.1